VQRLTDAPTLRWAEVHPADRGDFALVHPDRHVQQIAELARSGGGWVDPDTFVTPASFDAASYAQGAMLQAIDDVLAGRERNGFVVVRPPGHHATAERAMGFCLFNTIAVGTQWALTQGRVGRVAILDIDVHHGNGTEAIFFERPDVLYYSTHQYPFYPGTGRIQDIGRGEGTGTTVNVPLAAGCGDETYLLATRQVLVPSLRRFEPDLILVSLGFDAHWADPLAQMRMTTAGYAAVLETIRAESEALCRGRLVCLLEGGYDLPVLEDASEMAARVLLGDRWMGMYGAAPPPAPEPARAAEIIAAVCEAHDLPHAGFE
jgi:acetoin utilization deacetylase AcuC-like enzyme